MSTIANPNMDLDFSFGSAFNYAQWPKETKITLTNVPWSNTYKDIVLFEGNGLNDYINNGPNSRTEINNVSYARYGAPIRLNLPFNQVQRFNYLRASNPAQVPGDNQRDFYYFILDVAYLAGNTTQVIIQLDVWQTFGRQVSFGLCYVERGHISIANERQFDSFGRDYLTQPEGLNIGTDYAVVAKKSDTIMTTAGESGVNYEDPNAVSYLVASTTDLKAEPGTVNDPKLYTADGSGFGNIASGTTYWIFKNIGALSIWLFAMREKPWVTQGIVSIKVIPNIKRYYPDFTFPDEGMGEIMEKAPNGLANSVGHDWDNWRESAAIRDYIPEKYRHLKKLWTFPYMQMEITTFGANPIVLKPELWQTNDGYVREYPALLPPNERIVFVPRKYNVSSEGIGEDTQYPGYPGQIDSGGDDNGDFLDIATQISNLPSVAMVNNGALGFLAANNNSIAQQYTAADWSQQRALAANQAAYDNTTNSIQANTDLSYRSQAATARSTMLGNATSDRINQSQNLTSGAQSIAGAVTGLNPLGLASTAAQVAMGSTGSATQNQLARDGNTAQANVGIELSRQNNQIQTDNASFIRDTNKSLGDWAANGDYAMAIGAIQAKVQDAMLIQPSMSGQVGGETFNLINNFSKLSLRVKMIHPGYIRRIGDYWCRYGYAVNTYLDMREHPLMVMDTFTYWKMSESNIIAANMPESFKNAIRGIFEKGVTVWNDPEKVGRVDPPLNIAKTGIRY